jgi:hypothetical protein
VSGWDEATPVVEDLTTECFACDGYGYHAYDEGYNKNGYTATYLACDGSGIEPPVAATEQAAVEKNEATLRTDFTRVMQLRRESDEASPRYGNYLRTCAESIENSWQTSDHAADWDYLDRAHLEWREFPDTMSGLFQHMHKARTRIGVNPLTDVQWRSQEQARHLTGHERRPTPPS